ncbi:CaaX protease [Xylariaceae sp. FL1019]|nr:CaaX protease [Xylariaceae sp. FL1019]
MPSIKNYLSRYFGQETPKPPPITTATAAALLVVYTLIYVVPFYLSATTRPSRTLSRDAPSVIRARITSVSLSCVVCSVITFVIHTSQGHATHAEALHSLGYWPVGLRETASSLLLTAILFSGPLFENLVVDGAWRDWMSLRSMSGLWSEWTTWRNIVAGPLTEEILFRSASVPLMLMAHTSVTQTIFLLPVIFGLAHLHHFYEFRVTHPQIPVATGLLRSVLQFSYTSLFGAYATFLFLRTGSVLAIFATHAFCNMMGLPRFWGRVRPLSDYDQWEYNEDRDGGKAKQRTEPSIMWTIAYYVLLIAGAVGWWKNLGALTKSDYALVSISI